VFVYHEDFDRTRMITFALIWIALAIYTIHALLTSRQEPRAEPIEAEGWEP
jgi:EamA domain-containing membrane protein RarD